MTLPASPEMHYLLKKKLHSLTLSNNKILLFFRRKFQDIVKWKLRIITFSGASKETAHMVGCKNPRIYVVNGEDDANVAYVTVKPVT